MCNRFIDSRPLHCELDVQLPSTAQATADEYLSLLCVQENTVSYIKDRPTFSLSGIALAAISISCTARGRSNARSRVEYF